MYRGAKIVLAPGAIYPSYAPERTLTTVWKEGNKSFLRLLIHEAFVIENCLINFILLDHLIVLLHAIRKTADMGGHYFFCPFVRPNPKQTCILAQFKSTRLVDPPGPGL